MRGQYAYDDIQWVVFYAPEVEKTYAIGTTVVLPPKGVNAHALMRDSFELPKGVVADGTAPEPLPSLMPGPRLLGPELGASYEGQDAAVVLAWAPVKDLGPDERYEVEISTNYDEASPSQRLFTSQTQLTVPSELFHQPNCGVFNWQVRLVRLAGESADGSAKFEAESHASLYAYFLWGRAPGSPAEFLPLCPNIQY